MKEMFAKRCAWILSVTTVLAAGAFAQSADVKAKKASVLTGTWLTTVTPPAESGVPAFKLIFTFTDDGNLVATGTGGLFPALGNPCQGAWAAAGKKNEFTVTYLCLDFDQSLQSTGMDKIRGNLAVNDAQGSLSGRLDLTNFDLGGNQIFTACCATVAGQRLRPERIP
jgi:hypothetical protein